MLFSSTPVNTKNMKNVEDDDTYYVGMMLGCPACFQFGDHNLECAPNFLPLVLNQNPSLSLNGVTMVKDLQKFWCISF